MTTVLAVDGGQSGIRMRHSEVETVVEVEGVSRSEDSVREVAENVARGCRSLPTADRVVLGLTTAPVDRGGAERLCALVATASGASEVWLADDTVTSHYGALSGDHGVALIVGTGVACLALNDVGDSRVFDGHGYLLGDRGGAFWIGRRALGLVLRGRDRGETGPFDAVAEQRYGSLDGLHARLHEERSPVDAIAQIAREVLASAAPDAARILDDAAAALTDTALAAASWIGGTRVPLALGGRLLEHGSLRSRVDALLSQEPHVDARSADSDPLEGALRLGTAGPGLHRKLLHTWTGRTPS